MTVDELASSIKQKYPDYQSMDNTDLVNKITTKYPEYKQHLDGYNMNQDTSLAGRDARTGAVTDAIKTSAGKLLSPLKDAALAPFKVAEASKKVGDYAGRGAEVMAIGAGLPDPVAKAVGFTQSIKNDPLTYAGELGEPIFNGLKSIASKAVESSLPGIMKFFGNVPERATEIANKAKFKLPPVSEGEIQQGVENVGKALEDAKASIGKDLNHAKGELGIPTTLQEREASIVKYGNPHGVGGPDIETGAPLEHVKDYKNPNDLVAAVKDFREKAASMASNTRAKVASYLQDQINNFVDWNKGGTVTEGVLKNQYSDLGTIIEGSSSKLAAMKAKMADVLEVFNDLHKKFKEPGKAEDFLRSIFMGKKAATNDYLQKLAHIEVISGKPVLTDLFNKFASESFSKVVGRPGLATAEGLYGAMHLNPLMLAALGAQSPKVLGLAGKAGYAASKAVNAKTAMMALQAAQHGFPISATNELNGRVLQSIKDRLKNNAK